MNNSCRVNSVNWPGLPARIYNGLLDSVHPAMHVSHRNNSYDYCHRNNDTGNNSFFTAFFAFLQKPYMRRTHFMTIYNSPMPVVSNTTPRKTSAACFGSDRAVANMYTTIFIPEVENITVNTEKEACKWALKKYLNLHHWRCPGIALNRAIREPLKLPSLITLTRQA